MTDNTEVERVKFALRLAIVAAQLKETREALDSIRADVFRDVIDAHTDIPADRACTCSTSTSGATRRRNLPVRQCEGTSRFRPPTSPGAPS